MRLFHDLMMLLENRSADKANKERAIAGQLQEIEKLERRKTIAIEQIASDKQRAGE
jgi:hypothetical protein